MCGCVCKYYTRCASSTSWINLSQMMSPYQYIYISIFYIFTYNSNTNFSLAHISMCMHTYASQCVSVYECARWMSRFDIFTSVYSMYVYIYLSSCKIGNIISILLGSLWNWYNLHHLVVWATDRNINAKRLWKQVWFGGEFSPFLSYPPAVPTDSVSICVASNGEEQTMRIDRYGLSKTAQAKVRVDDDGCEKTIKGTFLITFDKVAIISTAANLYT